MEYTDRFNIIRFLLIIFVCQSCVSQVTDSDWFDYFVKTGTACKTNTCRKDDKTCECYLTVEHELTMMNRGSGSPRALVKPKDGRVVHFTTGETYNETVENRLLLADGYRSRIVITVNGRFPGPEITAYEYQDMIVHVRNRMHTDAITVHWHGMHQRNTPYSDGVAFVTQCPILPGQQYTYRFNAKPFGTSFYHAHIGDQRSMGLYGPLIILPKGRQKISKPQEGDNVFVVSLQDWNHDDDDETLYQKMLWGVYNLDTGGYYNETSDLSGAKYSRFKCHSGLVNGRGRFYTTANNHNGSPLHKFIVKKNEMYRFRVISAATLYPFRVYVQNHRPLLVVASDGFELQPQSVESIIIHPGERIDFLFETVAPEQTYLFVAETLEVGIAQIGEYHAAEAIIHYMSNSQAMNINPSKAAPNTCTDTCREFNCPFQYYPATENTKCLTFNDAESNDPNSNVEDVDGEATEYFFNFAFPGEKGYTPGSVNGRQFLPPTVSAYSQPDKVDYNCDACNSSKICECTYAITIDSSNKNKIYQFVLTNIGVGAGWSHPIHLHGHSFYVMKMAYAMYDPVTGKLIKNGGQDNIDIICNDSKQFCSDAKWRNESWANGKHPDLNWNNPPQKDSIIVPTGGYVIIRFKADNPGVWFFHCHIDLHNTNGMGMIINEVPSEHPQVPNDFPKCDSFSFDTSSSRRDDSKFLVTFLCQIVLLVRICI